MTKSQIKAELRRSALKDKWPFSDIKFEAFDAACDYIGPGDYFASAPNIDLRTFFLLVAEAL